MYDTRATRRFCAMWFILKFDIINNSALYYLYIFLVHLNLHMQSIFFQLKLYSKLKSVTHDETLHVE